jgi:hypothetical protein
MAAASGIETRERRLYNLIETESTSYVLGWCEPKLGVAYAVNGAVLGSFEGHTSEGPRRLHHSTSVFKGLQILGQGPAGCTVEPGCQTLL